MKCWFSLNRITWFITFFLLQHTPSPSWNISTSNLSLEFSTHFPGEWQQINHHNKDIFKIESFLLGGNSLTYFTETVFIYCGVPLHHRTIYNRDIKNQSTKLIPYIHQLFISFVCWQYVTCINPINKYERYKSPVFVLSTKKISDIIYNPITWVQGLNKRRPIKPLKMELRFIHRWRIALG